RLLDMQRGMPAGGCDVIALIDRHKDAGEGAEQWSDTRVLRVRPGGNGTFETIAPNAERDTGAAQTLASFVAGVFRRYPAQHHAVFIWDHGAGWGGICTDDDVPGKPGEVGLLSLAEVRLGLRTGLHAAGLLKLDLLAFDACLMAQLEVALAVQDLADNMVASEAVVPGSGYPYTQVIPLFGSERSPRDIAAAMVTEYGSFSDSAFESGSTLCAFDLQHAASVAKGLDEVAGRCLQACDSHWQAIARALFFAECFEVRADRVADHAQGSIDLVDLSLRLRGIPGTDAALEALRQQIAAMVIARYKGAERTLSKGLSIYGPHRRGQYRADYDQAPLACGNRWPQLLARVHAEAARDQSPLLVADFRQLDAFGKPSAQAAPFGGDRLLFTATGNSIVEVRVHDWQFDQAAKRWLLLRKQLVTDPMWPARWATAAAADMIDLVMPQFVDGRNELFHELSGLTFAVTDGSIQTYGTLDMATPSTQAPITALARFTAKATGRQDVVQVAFDRAEWNMVSMRPITNPAPGSVARALAPAAGDTFEFWFETMGEDGKEAGFLTPALTWGEAGLRLIAEPDEPGRYRAEMIARTIEGRTATASHDYEIVENPDLKPWPESWQDFDPNDLVGTWDQFKIIGPQQYQDLKTSCEVAATDRGNLFTVVSTGGPTGTEFVTRPFWFFEFLGMPCLRIVTMIADGQKFGWYGPVRLGEKDGKKVLFMKAVNTSGVVWEWRKR
ncbi:MAG: hypothetical protein KDC98_08385, partial [Planctomycetes bacterium]|nr:hypothetical protein [Planctomycetota bacterium]